MLRSPYQIAILFVFAAAAAPLFASLRDFDLKKRLFKYPCSFLIYSDSFNALPPLVLDYVKTRLSEIFDGKEGGSDYARLSPDDRDNIREIVAATWKGAPESWKY